MGATSSLYEGFADSAASHHPAYVMEVEQVLGVSGDLVVPLGCRLYQFKSSS